MNARIKKRVEELEKFLDRTKSLARMIRDLFYISEYAYEAFEFSSEKLVKRIEDLKSSDDLKNKCFGRTLSVVLRIRKLHDDIRCNANRVFLYDESWLNNGFGAIPGEERNEKKDALKCVNQHIHGNEQFTLEEAREVRLKT